MKGELEGYRRQLSALRAEQAPWEAQLAEVNGRVNVAAAERDLLLKKQADAEKRLKAGSATRQHADLMPMCQSNIFQSAMYYIVSLRYRAAVDSEWTGMAATKHHAHSLQ